MQDHGRPNDGTLQFSWVDRSAQKTRRTNDQRKISLSSFTFYALEFVRKFPTPSKSRDANICRGWLPIQTSPSPDPSVRLKLRARHTGTKLSVKLDELANPTPRLLRCLYSPEKSCSTPLASLVSTSASPKRGSEGSAYRISPKGEAVRLPKLIEQTQIVTETRKQRMAILMQVYSNLVTNVRTRTHLVGAFPPLIPPR